MPHFDNLYYYPIFTTYCNNVPLNSHSGIVKARHIFELYHCYADKHNNHTSPYLEWHLDPLERRIHQLPDVEAYHWDDLETHWYVGISTSHALHGAYRHALQTLGDALQPENWDCSDPWRDYNFDNKLAEIGMLHIPKPASFQEGVYSLAFHSFHKLQQQVHHNNFYAMCLIALAYVVNAVQMNHYHNLAYAGYMRGSPGFVSAHHYWCRIHGYAVTNLSKDDESTAGESGLANLPDKLIFRTRVVHTEFEPGEQDQDQEVDKLAPDLLPPALSPMEEEGQPVVSGEPSIDTRLSEMLRKHLTLNGIDQPPCVDSQPHFLPASPIAGLSEQGLEFLLQRLQEVALQQQKGEVTKERSGTAAIEWKWSAEPDQSSEPLKGLPEWVPDALNLDSSSTWEVYWEGQREESQGNLASHLIVPWEKD
ncbi:hypothetical protein RhiTH_011249 [Rhizoctonia solani]